MPVTPVSSSGPPALSFTFRPETARIVRLAPVLVVACSIAKAPDSSAPPMVSLRSLPSIRR
jgi:hypothetical protein